MRAASAIVYVMLCLVACGSSRAEAQDDPHFRGRVSLPKIARYLQLPMRMMSEVTVEEPVFSVELEAGLVAWFDKIVQSDSDAELQIEAARSLERIARDKHGKIDAAIPGLRKRLSATDRRLQLASARALLAAGARSCADELLKLCANGDDRLRLQIEPALAEWSFEPAGVMWRERLESSAGSGVARKLACDGLGALQNKADANLVRSVVESAETAFVARHAAARALVKIDQAMAATVGSAVRTGDLRDRLLAVELFAGEQTGARQQLVDFCGDSANGVAAQAWRHVERLEPELLKPLLATGRRHADSEIRLSSIRTMQQFPTPQHVDWLLELLGDEHIAVRNHARIALVACADTDVNLKERVVAGAAAGLDSNWQQIEQSLLIAATLQQSQFTTLSVSLLEHERPEVFVTAAWLMHLYPDAVVMPAVEEIMKKGRRTGSGPPVVQPNDVGMFTAHVFQLAGYTGYKPMQPMFEVQFSKTTGLNPPGRAAAMWAIGMLHRDNPEPELVTKLVSRLNDRSAIIQESDLVRRMAVMSLGRMQAISQLDQVQNAYEVDSPDTVIPEAARWALKKLGQESPPPRPIPDHISPVGGWRLSPIN